MIVPRGEEIFKLIFCTAPSKHCSALERIICALGLENLDTPVKSFFIQTEWIYCGYNCKCNALI